MISATGTHEHGSAAVNGALRCVDENRRTRARAGTATPSSR